jgi:hypothetical protein
MLGVYVMLTLVFDGFTMGMIFTDENYGWSRCPVRP